MPEIITKFEVYCNCGNGLCNQTDVREDRHGNPVLHIDPCEKCLDKARDEGHEEGYDEGIADGRAENAPSETPAVVHEMDQ